MASAWVYRSEENKALAPLKDGLPKLSPSSRPGNHGLQVDTESGEEKCTARGRENVKRRLRTDVYWRRVVVATHLQISRM